VAPKLTWLTGPGTTSAPSRSAASPAEPAAKTLPLVVVGAVVKPSFTLLVSALALGWSSTMRMVRVPLALLPPASLISRARTSVLSLTPGVV
jgi:hypothetical protein